MRRRDFITTVAAGTGAAWATPAILTMDGAAAATCCPTASVTTLVAACRSNVNQPLAQCTTVFTNTVTFCRPTATTRVILSRTGTGTLRRAYFDEVGILTVTPPTGPAVVWNFLGYQADCQAVGAANTLTGFNQTSQCSSTVGTVGGTDITAMFGTQCGLFTVQLDIRNRYNPYGWSQVFLVPQ